MAPLDDTDAANPGNAGLQVLFLLRKVDCNDGIASYCQTLAAGLASSGIPVSMVSGPINVTPGTKRRQENLERALSLWWPMPWLTKVPTPRIFLKILSLISERNISMINVHGLGMIVWGKLLSIVTGIPFVATYHRGPSVQGDLASSISHSMQPLTFLQKLLLQTFRPDRLIVLSEETKLLLQQQCPAMSARTIKICGGVDDDYFRPPLDHERRAARARFNIADDEMLCLHVGRLSWIKGQDLLIGAVRKVRELQPEVTLKCFFVGNGGATKELNALAFVSKQDQETFTFLGYSQEVRELMWAADVFALPSRLEGFALVVAEAMSTGLVPIRTPSGGCADQIVEGRTGYVVPFEDVDALAGALLKLTDPQVRKTMSEECLRLARERFSRKALVKGTIELMQSLTGHVQSRNGGVAIRPQR
jgi:glycosyltransferase involved in cell wall biosynthesis